MYLPMEFQHPLSSIIAHPSSWIPAILTWHVIDLHLGFRRIIREGTHGEDPLNNSLSKSSQPQCESGRRGFAVFGIGRSCRDGGLSSGRRTAQSRGCAIPDFRPPRNKAIISFWFVGRWCFSRRLLAYSLA